MKYLGIASFDFGGAGIASVNAIDRIAKMGAEVQLIVLYKKSKNEFVTGIYNHSKLVDRIIYFFVRIIRKTYKSLVIGKTIGKYSYFDSQLNFATAKKLYQLLDFKPDIISISWVTDFVSYKTINELKRLTGAKIIYNMTDNAPITGGCHYPWDCKAFYTNCYPCPALCRINSHHSENMLKKKKVYIENDDMIIGTTNDINRAKKSFIFKDDKHKVSVAVRDNPYFFEKKVGRYLWGISDDTYVVFFGSKNISDKRKGFDLLVEALKMLKSKIDSKNIVLLVAGESVGSSIPFNVKYIGVLNFEDLFKAFCTSDLFVCPSVEDSGPMMINYAFLANIPIVAFEMGVALDLIKHKRNGYIAENYNVEDYCDGIIYCYKNKEYILESIVEVNKYIKEQTLNSKNFYKIIGLEK